jgi:uncharacterized membrane protein YkgB
MERTDIRLTRWAARHGPSLLRIALGIVFLWFGALKFWPGLSPADELAGRTIKDLTFGLIEPGVSRPILATWETLIGLGLLIGCGTKGWRSGVLRGTLLLLALQMPGTFLPLVLYPAETWRHVLLVPTLEGQYIIKNLVLIAAAIVVGATVRGGAIVADPALAARAKAEEGG